MRLGMYSGRGLNEQRRIENGGLIRVLIRVLDRVLGSEGLKLRLKSEVLNGE